MVIISSNLQVFKAEIEQEFSIKYLGDAMFLLGMNIDPTLTALHVHQLQYIKQKLIEFNLHSAPMASCLLNPKGHLKAATKKEHGEY